VQFDLNLNARPANERARLTLTIIRELVGLVADAQHHLKKLRDDLRHEKSLEYFMKRLRTLVKATARYAYDSFKEKMDYFFLSYLVTNYLVECANGSREPFFEPFQVRLPAGMKAGVNVMQYISSNRDSEF